ncbi:MAG: CbrC family protein [Hyphomicrobiaceae bacterium]
MQASQTKTLLAVIVIGKPFVSESIVEVVSYRTPGFNGWQQEQWWTHWNDAAQFIGLGGAQSSRNSDRRRC